VVILLESATDADIILAVEDWLRLLEREDYDTAAAEIDSPPGGSWTAAILRDCVNYKGYGDRDHYSVTLHGAPRVLTDGRVFTQRKDIDRTSESNDGELHEVWYDLFLDGELSYLTATFRLARVPQGLVLRLYDICVR
jgi:hypothetical protein